MNVQVLEKNVISQLRSCCNINSISQCVTELVHNSLDAKSTAISVRVNLTNFRIQVVDNGNGISRTNLELLGQQYMTNKCHNLQDLRHYLKYYGYRGEALWSISRLSKSVKIATREQNSNDTFIKIIDHQHNSRIEIDKYRPSCGTTVTIDNFLFNLPVRQKTIKVNELDLIKKHLENLIIIQPQVSFSLRDDTNGNLLLNSCTSSSIMESFHKLYPDFNTDGFSLIKVSKERTSIKGLLHKDLYGKKTLQFIYVNKRPINCSKIRNFICTLYKKYQIIQQSRNHPVFIIMIKLPYSEVDFQLEPSKTTVLFKNYDLIKYCLEKLIANFFGKENSANLQQLNFNDNLNKDYGLSQFVGAVKGYASKRKHDDSNENLSINNSGKLLKEQSRIDDKGNLPPPPLPPETNPFIETCENDDDDGANVGDNMTLFTNFPENEERGKNLIMNMFIKSTQVYPERCTKDLIQNDPDLSRNGELQRKVSLGVQTSFCNDLVSIGVQTSPPPSNFITNDILENTQTLKPTIDDIQVFTTEMTRNLFEFTDDKIQSTDPQCNFKFSPKASTKSKRKSQIFTFPSISKVLENKSNNVVILDNFELSPISKSLESPYFPSIKSINDDSVSNKQNLQHNKHSLIRSKSDNYTDLNKSKINLNETVTSKYFQSKQEILTQPKDGLNETVTSKYFLPKQDKRDSQTFNESNTNFQFFFEATDPFLEQSKPNCEEIWTKEVNNFGTTIYVNKLTGAISLFSPKQEPICQMTKRLECVPKGMSPILKDIGPIDDMTPNSKEKLQNAMIAACDTELLTVKWQKYLDGNKDIRDFLAEIYAEKSKLIENTIPNICKSNLSKYEVKTLENISFTRELFENLQIIGQLDCKFIVTVDEATKLLVLFDQHAVHERVRLELLWQGYRNASVKIERGITFFLSKNNQDLLQNQREHLKKIGFVFNNFSDGVIITQVPQCLYNKSLKEANLTELTEMLLKEIIETLDINNGLLINIPKMLENIVNLEACRGAIKFGDPLSQNECHRLLQDLSQCTLPFQCAHGRPTLTPLLLLQKQFCKMKIGKPNLKNIKY